MSSKTIYTKFIAGFIAVPAMFISILFLVALTIVILIWPTGVAILFDPEEKHVGISVAAQILYLCLLSGLDEAFGLKNYYLSLVEKTFWWVK